MTRCVPGSRYERISNRGSNKTFLRHFLERKYLLEGSRNRVCPKHDRHGKSGTISEWLGLLSRAQTPWEVRFHSIEKSLKGL